MKNTQLRKILLGGAAVGFFVVPALAQDAQMETVTVTGMRASLQSAQSIKQNSDQVVDSITAVDIGALPDRNIAEALQRVPGVTLQRGDTPNDLVRMGSTGQAVFIRGLAWVKSLVNGRDEFTAVAGRSLSFGDVSADLMSSVNVYKSPTASQIEGGVGGTVDLVTRKPFDQDGFVYAMSGDYTYGSLIDKAVPSGNVLVSDRWNGKLGEFGALLSVDYQEVVNRTSGINIAQYSCWDVGNTLNGAHQYFAATDTGYSSCMGLPLGTSSRVMAPQGWAWRQMEFKQQRLASNLVLQWRPADSLEFTLFAMNTFAHNMDMEHYDYVNMQGTILSQTQKYDSNNNWLSGSAPLTSIDTRGGTGHNRNTDLSLNAKYTPNDNLEVTADLQYVESDSPYRNMTFYTGMNSQPNMTLSLGSGLNPDIPTISYTNQASNQAASNYYLMAAMDHLQYNSAHSINQRIDATYKFGGQGLFGFIKSADAGFRSEHKVSVQRSTGYNWGFLEVGWLNNGGTYVGLDGNINSGTSWTGQDGVTYNSVTGALKTATQQAQLFQYKNVIGNALPALWVPSSSLASMNTLQSYKIMQAYEPLQGVQTWYTGDQGWGQWTSYAAEHGCKGDDITCLAAYNTTPGGASSGNRQSRQAEETYAGYFQLDYGTDSVFGRDLPIDGNIGLRIVHTHDTISSGLLVMPYLNNGTCTPGNGTGGTSLSCADWTKAVAFLGGVGNQGTTIARPSVKNEYTNFLPSFNIRAKVYEGDGNSVQLRGAYYETILRPDFGYTYSSASLSFNFNDAGGNNFGTFKNDPSGYGGNPFLKPMSARNWDGSVEWYFSTSGSVTVSGFYKALSNYIFTYNTSMPFTNPVSGQTMNFVYSTYVNGDKGKVGGFELAYQQFYDFLPGFWSGFGMQANYTKIWNSGGHNQGSDVTSPTAVAAAGDKSLPLEGMSPDSYNVALLYAKYGIDFRAAWNWRSTYLSSSSDANNKIPVWTENYGQLDASVFYSFLDHYKVGVQASNLTGSVYHTDMGYKSFHPRTNWIEQDRKYALILRANW